MTSVKFILFTYIAAAICVLITINCYSAVKIDPFSLEYEITDMSGYFAGSGKNSLFIENSGLTVTAVNSGNKYIFSIDGGERNDGFYYAREVTCDSQDNIYILDKVINSNGKDIDSERILKYSSRGKFIGCLFEEDKLTGENVMGLKVIDDSIYAALVSDSDIQLLKITSDGKTDVLNKYEFAHASQNIQDVAISDDFNIAVVTKNGDVIALADNSVIFDASQYNSENYYAMALEAEFDPDGDLYINDIGNRVVMKYDGSKLTEFISRGEPLENIPEAFSELPIYSGLASVNGNISVTYADNYFDEASGEVIYNYNVYVVSTSADDPANKEVIFNGCSVSKSLLVFIQGILCSITIAFLAFAVLYTLFISTALLKRRKTGSSLAVQLGMLAIAVVTAGIVAATTISMTNQRYYNEVMNKMTNIAILMAGNVEEADINSLGSPDSFKSSSYNKIDGQVKSVLQNDLNADSGIYCVIYKVYDDIVCEVYSDETLHGTGYPMAGSYKGSAEQEIYQTGEYMSFGEYSSADGSYMFVLMPIKNSDGEVIALMEIGTDLYIFTAESNSLFMNILLYAAMTVIILLLVAGEIIVFMRLNKESKRVNNIHSSKRSAELVRPISFLLFFAANMSTAFLPIYGESLWHEGSIIPKEMASAIPLSAELLFAAITAFAGGFIVNRISARNVCIIGAVMYVSGNILCGIAPNLLVLILGNSVCGIGGGCFATSINSYVAGYEEEKQRNNGFAGYNAAYLAGMNCGTVVGSLISEQFGVRQAFFGASAVALASIFFILRYMDKNISKTDVSQKSDAKSSAMDIVRFILDPKVLRYFVLMLVPYLMCASFLNYFFPLFGEENALTSTQISSAFLISGLISIYLGPVLTDILVEKFGPKLSAVIASGIYIFAFTLFMIYQNIAVCFVIVGLLAIADSFGLTAQAVEYSSLDAVNKIGEGKSMGISSAFENTAYTLGPIVFSGLFMLAGYSNGIGIVGIVMFVLLALYVIPEFQLFRKNKVKK